MAAAYLALLRVITSRLVGLYSREIVALAVGADEVTV